MTSVPSMPVRVSSHGNVRGDAEERVEHHPRRGRLGEVRERDRRAHLGGDDVGHVRQARGVEVGEALHDVDPLGGRQARPRRRRRTRRGPRRRRGRRRRSCPRAPGRRPLRCAARSRRSRRSPAGSTHSPPMKSFSWSFTVCLDSPDADGVRHERAGPRQPTRTRSRFAARPAAEASPVSNHRLCKCRNLRRSRMHLRFRHFKRGEEGSWRGSAVTDQGLLGVGGDVVAARCRTRCRPRALVS